MIRRHTKRHQRGEAGREMAATELPYVVVDNPEMKDPGNLPRFPRIPQSGAPLRDWPFSLENTGPRWTTESMRDGWVPPSQEERQGAHGGQDVALQSYWRLIRTPVDPALEPPARGSARFQ